jgi:hypothetical protein
LAKGRVLTDYLGNGTALLLLSDKIVRILDQHHFTGWRKYPVKLFDRQDKLMNDVRYQIIGCTGRGGPIDPSCVDLWSRRVKPDGTRSINSVCGLRFDVGNWDGNDFFVLDEANWPLVTEPVIDALNESGATGWRAVPIEDFGKHG